MKQTTSLKIAILICSSIWATTSLAQKSKEKNSVGVESFYFVGRSNIDIGLFIPTGALSKSLKPSPNISYYFGLQISRKYSIDLGASFFLPIKPTSLNFRKGDSVIVGKPILSGTLGLWVSRIEKINKKITWENRIGSGVSALQTDIKKNDCKDTNDQFEDASTIFINFGTVLRKKMKNEKDIGIKLNYYFSPYNLFQQHLPANFGNQYVTLSISYGIN